MPTTPRGHEVTETAMSWVATRSGGPGGQHANTSDTAVTVTIDVAALGWSEVLTERVRSRAGETIIASSSQSRSQFRNRQLATATALERLDVAAAPPPPKRRATRPSRGATEERLQEKRVTSQRKAERRRPGRDDG
jgi:ribosome-associated protein